MNLRDIPVLGPRVPPRSVPDLGPAVTDALRALPPAGGLTVLVNDPQRGTLTPAVLGALAEQFDPDAVRQWAKDQEVSR